jgi:hypothetical protein
MTELPYGRVPYPLGFVHPATILDARPMPVRGEVTATLDGTRHALRVQLPRASFVAAGPLVREDARALLVDHADLDAAVEVDRGVSLRIGVLPRRSPGRRLLDVLLLDVLHLPGTSQLMDEAIT